MNSKGIVFALLTLGSLSSIAGDPFFGFRHFRKYFPFFGHRKVKTDQCYLEGVCRKTLPENTESEKCYEQRQTEIFIARQFYKLTEINSPYRATKFPAEEIPFLNQTERDTGFYFALDKFESRFIAAYSAITTAFGDNVVQLITNTFKGQDLKDPATHMRINQFVEQIIRSLRRPQIFSNPALEPTFTDVISTNLYKTDETFVQYFLAKTCPFTIRRVTPENADNGYSFLTFQKNFSPTFDIDKAIENAFGEKLSLEQAVGYGLLYVSHNEEFDGAEELPDIYQNQTGDSTLDKPTSPITIFIIKDGMLKVVAIQLDYKPDSEVVTPDSSFKWTKAKASVIAMNKQFCDTYMHAGHIHSVGILFCTVYRRHFSTLHPLYDVFKHHCEGTAPHIVLSYEQLFYTGGFVEKTHSVKYEGLVRQAFLDRQFGQMDLPVLLKRLGMSYYSKSKIEYYPFRDDAKEIWKELSRFVTKVVYTFYSCDEDVMYDKELQSFAAEMTFGGKGNFTGFPYPIASRRVLRKTMITLLWYPVIHTIINYGLIQSFPLGSPTKLYTNQVEPDTVLNLGNIENVAELVKIENLLANFRINRIMDYYDQVTDPRLKKIVYESYENFHGDIQKKLEKRNADRKEKKQLGIQFLEPKWMPTSIHI